MEELALGEMAMSFSELMNISPRSLFNKIYGFQRNQNDAWERMRLQTYYLLLPNIGKKERSSFSPRTLMKFPWDEPLKQLSKKEEKEKTKKANEIWELIDKGKNRDVGQ